MRCRFEHLSGSRQGRVEEIAGPRITMGRDPENALAFDPFQDSDVSGAHARLDLGPDGFYYLADLGSRNGTFLNGAPVVAPVVVPVGSVIHLGRSGPALRCVYAPAPPPRAHAAPAASPPPAPAAPAPAPALRAPAPVAAAPALPPLGRRRRKSTLAGDILGVALGIAFLVFGLRVRWEVWRASEWPTVPGQITSSNVSSHRAKNRTRYKAHVRYTYTVGSQTLAGDRLSPLDQSGSKQEADAKLARYRAGAACTVHYDPADPTKGYLEVVDTGGEYWPIGLGLFLVVVAGGDLVRRIARPKAGP